MLKSIIPPSLPSCKPSRDPARDDSDSSRIRSRIARERRPHRAAEMRAALATAERIARWSTASIGQLYRTSRALEACGYRVRDGRPVRHPVRHVTARPPVRRIRSARAPRRVGVRRIARVAAVASAGDSAAPLPGGDDPPQLARGRASQGGAP